MAYKIKLDIFEGPFDLLVYLIVKAEMSIYDIQVSEITRQYLDHLDVMQSRDLAVGGEFMALAADLIELKSKMLLPRNQGEGLEAEDPREELIQKLLERTRNEQAYRTIRAAAERLRDLEERNSLIFEKPKEDLQDYTNEPDEYLRMDREQFLRAFRLFIGKKQKIEEIRKRYARTEQQRATLESRISSIHGRLALKKTKTLRFSDFLEPGNDRGDVVLTFAALLEMVRGKVVQVRQEGNFAEITVALWEKEAVGV
jgi:segregation and condensation protein A